MKIQDLRQKEESLRKQITELSQISEKSKEQLQTIRDMKVDLAIVEDAIDAHSKKVEAIKARSNISKRFATRTFETFEQDENKDAYDSCVRYIENETYNNARNSLIICGSFGTGKTHLAAAIANSLMDKGISVLFDTYAGHLEKLKAEYDGNQPRTYLDLMKTVEMLVLDDVGKERYSEWSTATMFDVINNRYESMKPVVITSNFTEKELEKYFGNACYSRLVEMCSGIVTKGRDYRRG